MNKARSLSRLVQEGNKLLFNQEKENTWHCRLIRADAEAGQGFHIQIPDWQDQAFLITARDLGKHRNIRFLRDSIPVLADHVVDFPGQVLGVLLAPDTERLAECEQQLRISYEAAPPLSTNDDDTGDTWHSRRIVRYGDLAEELPLGLSTITGHQTWTHPENRLFEPRGVIAEWKSDMLWVQCSTSWPHLVRRLVSESTGLPQKNITVISQPAGSLSDRFLIDSSLLACYAAMGALTCMKKVQLFLSCVEDKRFATRQAPLQASLTTSHQPDGQITSLKAVVEIDCGTWLYGSQETMQTCLASLCSSYRIPNQVIEIRLKKSPLPPAILTENFGMAAMQQILEHHLSLACSRLNLDQHHFRDNQLLNRNDPTPFGLNLDSMQPAHQVLEHAARQADFSRKYSAAEQLRKHRSGSYRPGGIGLALAFQSHGLLTSLELLNRPKIRLQLSIDRHLTVHCPMHLTNAGLKEAWSEELAQILGIEERNITFCRFSTDQFEDSGPIRFSRLVSLYSPLLTMAAKSLKTKMSRQSGPLEIRLSMPNARRLKWDEDNFTGTPFLGRSWAAAVVELHLDPVALQPLVDQVWITIHAGAILVPLRASQLVRQAIRESLINQGCGDHLPARIEVEFLGHERYMINEQRFVHAGGIGELAAATIPAAFANALTQVLGQIPGENPVSSATICRSLHQAATPAVPPLTTHESALEDLLS